MKTRIMYFESIVLLAAESFSIYHQFFESLMALGRPRQSLTFVSRNSIFPDCGQFIREECQHMNTRGDKMYNS